jgi:hypothetical protein
MRIISLIDDAEIIKKILKHLGLWEVKRKPPPCANGPPPEAFIIYDQSSAPSVDDYLIDADYPIDVSRCSSKNEDGNLPLKKSSLRHTGELCPNSPNYPIARQKIKVDNKARFRYQVGYWCPLIDTSICCAVA